MASPPLSERQEIDFDQNREMPGELRLWGAVIEVALADAEGRGPAPPRIRELNRDQARRWLSRPSRGLHDILTMIDVDWRWWHQRCVPALVERWREVDAVAQEKAPRTAPALDMAA